MPLFRANLFVKTSKEGGKATLLQPPSHILWDVLINLFKERVVFFKSMQFFENKFLVFLPSVRSKLSGLVFVLVFLIVFFVFVFAFVVFVFFELAQISGTYPDLSEVFLPGDKK